MVRRPVERCWGIINDMRFSNIEADEVNREMFDFELRSVTACWWGLDNARGGGDRSRTERFSSRTARCCLMGSASSPEVLLYRWAR